MAIPAEAFFLPPGGSGTLQQRIRQMVTEGHPGRAVPAGRPKMPSSRGLAEHLGVSRITVTLAYADLVSLGLPDRARAVGLFRLGRRRRVRRSFRAAAPRAEAVDFDALTGRRFSAAWRGWTRPEDWHSYPYPFIYGQADPTLFDHQNWRLCALRALGGGISRR